MAHVSRLAGSLLLILFVNGCERPQPSAETSTNPPSPPSTHFDAATAGMVRGRITWAGDLPRVEPVLTTPDPNDKSGAARQTIPHPNAPAIDSQTRGVANAVVFLRGVDPATARPWDHAPLRVDLRGRQFHLLQGNVESRVGFVRRGDSVEMASSEDVFHSLRAEGAAFFTLAFPDSHRPRQRRLEQNGVVELSSGAGYFWMRAYLFVDDHPYFTRTDSTGKFTLSGVPPGRYTAVCWLPSWTEAGHSRDPETGLVTRLLLNPSVEKTVPIEITPKGTSEVSFTFAAKDFRALAPR